MCLEISPPPPPPRRAIKTFQIDVHRIQIHREASHALQPHTFDFMHRHYCPPKCCYFVAVGGLACLDDPRGYASWSFWLLEGSTMLDRLSQRGQTKCNTLLGIPRIPEAMSSGTSVPSGPTMMNRLWLRVQTNQHTTDACNISETLSWGRPVALLFDRSPDQWYSNPIKRNALVVMGATCFTHAHRPVIRNP